MKKVIVEYFKKGQSEMESKEIPIEEYFDPCEPGKNLHLDSAPRFLQPYEYVTSNTRLLIFVNLKIIFETESIEFKQTFWNDGENSITERIDNGRKDCSTIIINSKIAQHEALYEVMRFVSRDNKIFPVSHSYIEVNPNGTETLIETLDLKYFQKEIYK